MNWTERRHSATTAEYFGVGGGLRAADYIGVALPELAEAPRCGLSARHTGAM
ncbi:MAG: hypothetical protein WKH64_10130 [Chloroflexia bacterium]